MNLPELHRMIECLICKEPLLSIDELTRHLKAAHRKDLAWYKKTYPEARITIIPKDISRDELLAKVKEAEVKVDPRGAFEEKDLEAFDPTEITDIDYIRQILKDAYPEKWAFFCATKKELLDTGIPDCKALDQFVLQTVFLRDMYLRIMSMPDKKRRFNLDSEDVKILQQLTETSKKMMEQIRDIFERTTKEKTIDQELEKIATEAENFIRQNVGEFDFKCEQCGAVIDNSGLPHWAFEVQKDNQGRNIYLLWSDQLWHMVRGFSVKDIYGNVGAIRIPVWQMAHSLQTSVEGLIYTARSRGMSVDKFKRKVKNPRGVEEERQWASIDGVEFDLLVEEEMLRLAFDEYKREYHPKSVRDI